MSKLIPLSMWAERRYDQPPCERTLRRWALNRAIQPLPQKNGRSWYVQPYARYIEPETLTADIIVEIERTRLEMEYGEALEEQERGPEPDVIHMRREQKRFVVLPLDQLRGLPRVQLGVNCGGLYFLWRQAKLVYIGEAKRIYRRVREHKKRFTHATYLPLYVENRRPFECPYVLRYKPPLNYARHG